MSDTPENNVYRWKGKIIKKKTYEHRLVQQQNGLKSKKVKLTSNTCDVTSDKNCETAEETYAEGNRIVKFKTLGQQLWCSSCKEALSLEHIENEIRRGLGSQLLVRCHKCLIINQVYTNNYAQCDDKRSIRFVSNYKAVLGALHCGLGWTHLSKLFACMDIPCFDYKTYQRYEAEIGEAAEKVAKKSCSDAAALERKLTLEQIEDIIKLLPETTDSNFLLPSRSSNESNEESTSKNIVTFNEVVRILVSYDMGWSTRGAGRNYDSFNGFGAIIGYCSGLVLDYSTCNRKCRKCDKTDNPFGHKCRKNFYGSAKAMEAHVGKKIMVDSNVLKAQTVEVGVFIGDDDSSTIAACRAVSNHQIIKQSDVNHLSGGVKKQLYKIEKSHKELTKDRITYLHRCFMYAVTQNRGNGKKMTDAIRSIPDHTFNIHTNCGEWCGYVQDPENYDHKIVPGGFKDENLFRDLKNIFDQLAKNADKFSSGTSSNSNESLNAMMMSKHPKSRCYSTTASADYRYACTIGQKNLGEQYTQEIYKTINVSPGKHHSQHIVRTQKKVVKRRALIKTPQFKRRRIQLKANKSALRHRKEHVEGVTYKNNCSLLSESTIPINNAGISDYELRDNQTPIIIFDLETSGLDRGCDILQIGATYGKKTFNVYINPTRQVSASATAANGLVNSQGILMYHGISVNSVPLKSALVKLLEWLNSFHQKCYLAAHNLIFDGPRLFRAISACCMIDKFSIVISGFIDTLEIVRKVTGRKGKGACSVEGLSKFLNINTAEAHHAVYDCDMVNKIINKLNINGAMMTKFAKTYADKIQYWKNEERASKNLLTLLTLQKSIGIGIRKRLAISGCTFDILKNELKAVGRSKTSLFIQNELKRKGLTKMRPSSIEKIIDFMEE